VSVASRSEPATLRLALQFASPGSGSFDAVCTDLLTAESCDTIADALTATFTDNTQFLTDATLQVASDAAAGAWQLQGVVFDSTTAEVYFTDIFTVTVTVPAG
jgi:hypothetical protein